MKNICFICFDLSIVGGCEQVTCNVANALADAYPNKYRIHLLSLTGKNEHYKISENVIYSDMGLGIEHLKSDFVRTTRAVRRYYQANSIDVAFLEGHNVAFLCSWASLARKVRQIYCDHESFGNYKQRGDVCIIRNVAARLCSHIVVLTNATKADYAHYLHTKAEKISVINNWVEPAAMALSYALEAKQILSVGRFSAEKEFHSLLPEVAFKVWQEHPDWEWHLIGDGELFDQAKARINELGLESFLLLRGAANNVADQYGHYAFLVMTSSREGFPMVLLEAKGHALPTVAFDIATGPAEIIRDGVDGFLARFPDADAMAQVVCRLIESAELRAEMSKAALEDVKRFSKEAILQQWVSVVDGC